MQATGDIWVVADHRQGALLPITRELLAAARQLAEVRQETVTAVVLAADPEPLIAGLIGAERVLAVKHPGMSSLRPGTGARILTELLVKENPAVVLFPGTANGQALAPRVAARLDVGLIADCTAIEWAEDGQLLFIHPVLNNQALAACTLTGPGPRLATVRPKAFDPYRGTGPVPEVVYREPTDPTPDGTTVEEFVTELTGDLSLEEADIIVAGGRGTGGDFTLIRALANELGAAVGASRAAVDAGWVPYSQQIGQTGKTVAPKLYIACGISGAIQHLAGMQASETIVAINKNPEAPIFRVADYGLVGDLFEVIPEIIAALRQAKA